MYKCEISRGNASVVSSTSTGSGPRFVSISRITCEGSKHQRKDTISVLMTQRMHLETLGIFESLLGIIPHMKPTPMQARSQPARWGGLNLDGWNTRRTPPGHCPRDFINLKNAPHSWTFTSTPPLGHCPCDVIHIFQGWNKIAKGWNTIAKGWNKNC